ncbi:MAG: PIN domain-containing protein [Deltaproteobacteria bacterium]|nr:PIN domain-containing protein [Deltaproteobacteria bacterium]
MIYLDTNAIIWLAGASDQLSAHAKATINAADQLFISPMVRLEMTYLFEIGRIGQPAQNILDHLNAVLPLRECKRSFSAVVGAARDLTWTRDPFDRLITAQASLGADTLLTRDQTIRANYAHATW